MFVRLPPYAVGEWGHSVWFCCNDTLVADPVQALSWPAAVVWTTCDVNWFFTWRCESHEQVKYWMVLMAEIRAMDARGH